MSTGRAQLEVLFSSPRFRVKCHYGYHGYYNFKGTMIIEARESRTIDAIQEAYEAIRAEPNT